MNEVLILCFYRFFYFFDFEMLDGRFLCFNGFDIGFQQGENVMYYVMYLGCVLIIDVYIWFFLNVFYIYLFVFCQWGIRLQKNIFQIREWKIIKFI